VFNSLAWDRTDVVRAEVKDVGAANFAIQDHAGKNVPFEVVSAVRDTKGRVTSAEIVFVAKACRRSAIARTTWSQVGQTAGTQDGPGRHNRKRILFYYRRSRTRRRHREPVRQAGQRGGH